MLLDTIFFSYSRDDSEFVLTLAKNLRQSGANIWLDQLDIKPGTRWDKSIEAALKNSSTLLVILSKNSVESTNVMDEVSFALEENKTVVPVLLEECDIPFRLRRLQFADFSKDQSKGLKTLAEALHLTGSVADKLTDSILQPISGSPEGFPSRNKVADEKEVKPVEINKPAGQTEPNTQSRSNPVSAISNRNRILVISAGLVIVLAALGLFFKNVMFPDEDLTAWELALKKDSISEYEFYIRTNPQGKFILTARDSTDSKKEQEKALLDTRAWNKADSINSVVAIEKYLKEFAQGKYVQTAIEKRKMLIDDGEKIVEDNQAWTRVKDSNLIDALASYVINDSIIGQHKSEALARMNEVGNQGWFYNGRIDGEFIVGNPVLELIWRDSIEVKSNMKPKIGDILIVTRANNTHNRVGTTTAEGATGKAVKKDKKVILIGVEERGNALFTKVRYD